jgi:HEAT repeat protein
VREAALNRLAEIDPKSKEVEKAMLMAIQDQSALIRKTAVNLLSTRSPDSVPFAGVFRTVLRDPDAEVRSAAFQALGRIGLDHPSATVALCEALRNPATHEIARSAIARMHYWPSHSGSAPAQFRVLAAAVAPLVQAMRHDDARTAGTIATLLFRTIDSWDRASSVVPEALRTSLPPILVRLQKREPEFRRHVLIYLLTQNPKQLYMLLVRELANQTSDPARSAARATKRTVWTSALESLEGRVRAGYPQIRRTWLIQCLPKDLVEATLPEICQGLADEDEDVRFEAFGALTYDRSLLASSDAVRRGVVAGLGKALQDPDPGVREWAVTSIADLRPIHADSVPALRQTLSIEQVPSIRSRIDALLRQIDPKASEPGARP